MSQAPPFFFFFFFFGLDALLADVIIIHFYSLSNGFLDIFLDILGSIRFGLMKEGAKGNSHVYVLCTVFASSIIIRVCAVHSLCFLHNYCNQCTVFPSSMHTCVLCTVSLSFNHVRLFIYPMSYSTLHLSNFGFYLHDRFIL